MQLNLRDIDRIITAALDEDVGRGDITSVLMVPFDATATLSAVTREDIVVCGADVVPMVFKKIDAAAEISVHIHDGEKAKAGDKLLTVKGNARGILMGERVALNLLIRMCAVATLTRKFVDAVAGTKATILDTRKTMPGLREIDKYAVRMAGGRNHRMRLDDGILIKDNHLAIHGSLTVAIQKARAAAPVLTRIEVECETLEQVLEAAQAGADMIMLDNMDTKTMTKVVEAIKGKIPLEASGNVTLESVRQIAETGVDFISVGRLTHSAPAVDIGLDFQQH